MFGLRGGKNAAKRSITHWEFFRQPLAVVRNPWLIILERPVLPEPLAAVMERPLKVSKALGVPRGENFLPFFRQPLATVFRAGIVNF